MNDDFQINFMTPGIYVAKTTRGMNLPDLLIMYLACGAPFGVYYFLQNRNRTETRILWLKSLFRFIFWIPFAVRLVARTSFLTNLYNLGFVSSDESDLKNERDIEEIRKYFEKKFAETDFTFSIYEFREIFDRYVGLSVEIRSAGVESSAAENEFYRITNHNNKKLGAACLNRRNRTRLSFHQKLARRDFFEIVGKFFDQSRESAPFFAEAVKLTRLVHDFEAQQLFENLSAQTLQTPENRNVRKLEKEIWNSGKHKSPIDNTISTNLRPLTATANLSNKD
jgi:uncharacterized protein YozE (UPF0346 family)